MSTKATSTTTAVDDTFPTSSWTPSFSPDQLAVYYLIGLLTATLPAYLYHGVYGIDYQTFGLVYGIVVILSAGFLTVAYKQTENNAHLSLAAIRGSAVFSGKRAAVGKNAASVQQTVTTYEAQSWSFMINNLIYGLSFLFLAFYVLRAFDTPYDYALSSIVAAAAAWQIGAAISK